jgi:exodeoxyribonuclease VIII
MKPGVYNDISNAEYHGGPGVSNSGLALIRRSPLHFRARQLAANDNAHTAAQAIGTAFHALLLEPESFYRDYCLGLRQSDVPGVIDSRDQLVEMIVTLNAGRLPKLTTTGTKDELVARLIEAASGFAPKNQLIASDLMQLKGAELKQLLDRFNEVRPGLLSVSGTIPELAARLRAEGVSLKLWDEAKAEWLANNGQRTVLEPEEWDQLMNMRDAVMAHPIARALLTGRPGKAEQSVYWVDQATGVLCRCRPDFWRDDNLIVDLKTTEDASPEGFAKSIANWSYDTQAAFYADGVLAATGKPLRAFVFLAVEKSARVVEGQPLGVAVYQLDEAGTELGRAKYREDLGVYAQCVKSNVWPCYGDKLQTISLPQWHMNKNAHLLDRSA